MIDIRYGVQMDTVRPVTSIIPGAQGRILAVLAETTAPLSLRSVARLSKVSPAQASRVLPDLVELGLVDRAEVPPSSLFTLNYDHVAAQAILLLASSHQRVLEMIGEHARQIDPPPLSMVVFGSFARREATPESDIDVVVVRADDVSDDNDDWATSLERWRRLVHRLSGHPVEVIELTRAEVAQRLVGPSELWSDVVQDGLVVHGAPLTELKEPVSG